MGGKQGYAKAPIRNRLTGDGYPQGDFKPLVIIK
jgi:hypothetical protein